MMRLLLVENHRVFAETVRQQFLSAHDTAIVATIAAARRTLAGGAVDVVLVDYDLDDGKGDELVRSLRASSFTGRIIGISAHQAGNDALVAAGADAVCAKGQFHLIGTFLTA